MCMDILPRCLSVYRVHILMAVGGQKRVLDLLELELQLQLLCGSKELSSGLLEDPSALNHHAFSTAPLLFFKLW